MKLKKILFLIAVYLISVGSCVIVDYYYSKYITEFEAEAPISQEQETVQEPVYLKIDQALQLINKADLKKWLYYIASKDLDGRKPGTEGFSKAVKFIEERCKEMGVPTERQRVPNAKDDNLFAYIDGVGELKNEIIVVGAHLDHLGKGRLGADDNGSGSVALLGILKAFSKMGPQKRTIVFQWYTGEEFGLLGSRFYVDNPIFPKSGPDIKKHIAMINLDMIGRLKSEYRTLSTDFRPKQNSNSDLYRFVDELNEKYSFAKQITKKGSGASDHAPFLAKGIPAVFVHTGLHSDYHRTTDICEKINYDGLEQITCYATELLYKCVNLFGTAKNTTMSLDTYFEIPLLDHDLAPFEKL